MSCACRDSPSSSSPTSPASSRVPARARASATSSCSTSSAPACCASWSTSRPSTAPDPHEQERILLHELGEYQPELLDRPRLVVGTKSDIGHLRLGRRGRSRRSPSRACASWCSRCRRWCTRPARQQPETEGIVIIRPEPEGARVERLDEHEFRLIGRQVERVVALNDVTTPEALSYIDYALKRLGVPKMLARAGARDGDIVWIAGFSFEYQEEV